MTRGKHVVRYLACLVPHGALMHFFNYPLCSEAESAVASGKSLRKGKWAATNVLRRAWAIAAGRRKQVQHS